MRKKCENCGGSDILVYHYFMSDIIHCNNCLHIAYIQKYNREEAIEARSKFDEMTTKPFMGLDGKPWSDEYLLARMQEAVESEEYEWAAECRDELERRAETQILKQIPTAIK